MLQVYHSNFIFQICFSNLVFQISFFEFHFLKFIFQISFFKFHFSNFISQISCQYMILHNYLRIMREFDQIFNIGETMMMINFVTYRTRFAALAVKNVFPERLGLGRTTVPHFKALICGYLLWRGTKG